MTALSAVLPRNVVQNITKRNELFPGLHGTEQQLRALWALIMGGRSYIWLDLDCETTLHVPSSLPEWARKVQLKLTPKTRKKTKNHEAHVKFTMEVFTHKWWPELSTTPGKSNVLRNHPGIHRKVLLDQPEPERLTAFRQMLVDFSSWYGTLRLCDEDGRHALYCGQRAFPGSTKCAACVLRAGFRSKRTERRAKRQKLE